MTSRKLGHRSAGKREILINFKYRSDITIFIYIKIVLETMQRIDQSEDRDKG